jgi:predicted PurR-regulated permease PerM
VKIPENNPDFLLCLSRGFVWRLVLGVGVCLLLFFEGNVLLITFAGVLLAVILRGITIRVAQLRFIGERWAYAAVLSTIVIIAAAVVYALGARVLTQAHEIARTIPTSVGNLRAELDQYSWGQDITRIVAHSFRGE